jgi:hypothetical protein
MRPAGGAGSIPRTFVVGKEKAQADPKAAPPVRRFGHPSALLIGAPLHFKEQQMSDQNAVVAVYASHTGAEDAVKILQSEGIDMKTLSIIGKDTHTDEHVVGYYNAGDRMKYWGKQGAFWGGFWGLLFGSAFFAIPGLGPILVAGPVIAWIVGAVEGAVLVGGLSALGAGLYSMGIPKDSVVQYEMDLKTDKYLLLVHGTASEVERARGILARTQPLSVTVHAHEPVAV